MIELDAINITHLESPLFSAVSAQINAGEILTLMGASGIGKSTLIDAISGQLSPVFKFSGDIRIDGKSIIRLSPQARKIGVLYQDANLFPHMSIGQNVAFGLSDEIKKDRRGVVEAALEEAGLGGFYDRDPSTLSGGQKTRAALLRTVLARPKMLCLDEPFAKLDPKTREDIKTFTFNFIKTHKIPTLLVTHDVSDAPERVVQLSAERVD